MQTNTVLDEVWRLTKDIEQAAAVGEWQTAASLSSQREPLTRQLSTDQPPHALAMIREIVRIDQEVARNAAVAQNELTAEYRTAMNSVRKVSSYEQVARL